MMKVSDYDVSGYMGDDELTELARLAGAGTVLEIGTWNGRSAVWMALQGATVYCLDTFHSDDMGPGITGWTLGNLVDAAKKHGVHERIKPLNDTWENLLPSLDLSRYCLLHYDADHSYEATVSACRYLLQSCAPLAIHDADWKEPRRAIDDLSKESGRVVKIVGRLAVLHQWEVIPGSVTP